MRLLLLLAALGGCAAAPRSAPLPSPAPAAAPTARAPQTYRGIFHFGFEHSGFEGCSLSMGGEAWATFESRHPEYAETRFSGAVYQYEIAFEGVRNGTPGGQQGGYGHMGRASCEYQVTRLIESRRILPQPSR